MTIKATITESGNCRVFWVPEDHDDQEDFGCPGCDARPGDGYTADCHHPEGCGHWKAQGGLSNRLGNLK